MKNFFKISAIIIFATNPLYAKNFFLQEGISLFNNKKFEEAKFQFEKDIVLNPKSELSYLYLSKIFKNLNNKKLQEQNLNTVILLNPQNEEAVFNLAKLKLKESDYSESKKLIEQLLVFCKNYCQKSNKFKIEIENSQKK